jgi:hypothetical protein
MGGWTGQLGRRWSGGLSGWAVAVQRWSSRCSSYLGRINDVAKISISIPDELARDLRAVARENVSSFVSAAVRHELDRRRLFAFLDELEDELGPADEHEVAAFNAMFSETTAARTTTGASRPGRGPGAAGTGPASR